MAGEITVTTRLDINNPNGNIQYSSRPFQFKADQTNAVGPTPGVVNALVAGTIVSFSVLTAPGVCRIQNQDPTNYVEVGLSDGSFFYPLLELLPGESFVYRLYRSLRSREAIPGTGSSPTALNLMIRADTAACKVLVEAFDK